MIVVVALVLVVPVSRIAARQAQSQSPEVVAVGEEQLPEFETRRHAPRRFIRIAPRNTIYVFVALAVVDVGNGSRQAGFGYEDFFAVHAEAPFGQWQQRHGVAYMGDAVQLVVLVVGCNVEALIHVCVELLVPESWLSKSGHMSIPATRLEVQPSKRRNSAAERVPYQNQLVIRVSLQSLGNIWQDDLASVEPGRIEARVNSAVVALGRFGGRWVTIFGAGRRGDEIRAIVFVVIARVWDVFLGYGGEIGNGVCDRIGAAKGDNKARFRRVVREGDVSARV